ncbi:regulator of ribonuclease activity A [Sinobacterium caligoides]|uniref:4-hydroxy-4-methyl-2-oxoglutarate aldolase n=1 Tax=Sinobacterium caligoides TaxID=933926 RepID=A0A3N2DGN7_9GAMM|nr:ribonuclease E activity regulator RraA [Sinobacterium caligoides]ROR98901.1 regulator of ribonuclease activity A [Sinobacterium caligoides]
MPAVIVSHIYNEVFSVAELYKHPTICTPDLCDKYPDVQVLEPVFRNYGGKNQFSGEIVTVKCFEDNSLVKEQAGYLGMGKVLVVDGGGSLRRALLGDIIAETAASNGWEGMIIFGCIRDVDAIQSIKLGVQAINHYPVKTEKRGAGDLNIPVTFAGQTLKPGQYIYADNNGIVVSDYPLAMPNA